MQEEAECRRRSRARCDGAGEHGVRDAEGLGIRKNHEDEHAVETVFDLEQELVPGTTHASHFPFRSIPFRGKGMEGRTERIFIRPILRFTRRLSRHLLWE